MLEASSATLLPIQWVSVPSRTRCHGRVNASMTRWLRRLPHLMPLPRSQSSPAMSPHSWIAWVGCLQTSHLILRDWETVPWRMESNPARFMGEATVVGRQGPLEAESDALTHARYPPTVRRRRHSGSWCRRLARRPPPATSTFTYTPLCR